ncbi:hypothetical protein [Mycoplasmoides alvi]|uniref:hypothetical protein n=1 Tax=Mycoplasmoides alvi TaxID=78580 RepID=UPI00051BD437|nr:hypothetical protein [Mycoplasmoides alvi]
MKSNHNSNNNKRMVDFLEPSDFYSEKRNNSTNIFSVIHDTNFKEDQKNDDMNILDSFYIPTDDEKTHKIFDEVISYQNNLNKKNNLKVDLTDEILRVDLKNDDVFVKDVIESYEESFGSPSIKKDDLNIDSPKLLNFTDDISSDTIENSQHFLNNSELDDFVSTKHVDDNLFDNNRDDEKINSIKATLKDAYANQNELHKSIQIALDDVKKHQEDDFVIQSAQHVTQDLKSDDNLKKENHVSRDIVSDDVDLVIDTNLVNTVKNYDSNFIDNEDVKIDSHYQMNFKNKDDNFFFIDNTINSKKYSPNFTSLYDIKDENDKDTSKIDENTNSISEEKVKELVREQVQEEIARFQETQKLDRITEEELNEQKIILDNQVKMYENAQQELIAERQKIIDDAEQIKEKILLEAQNQINLEREEIENEREKLIALGNQIKQDKNFIEQQRQALLDAAKKETERLIQDARLDIQIKNNLSNDTNVYQDKLNLEDSFRNTDNNDLTDETLMTLDKFETSQNLESKNDENSWSDMEAIDENRSYTEKIIDSIEVDDFNDEEIIPVPTIPLEFTKTIKIKDNNQFISKFNENVQQQPTAELKNDVDVMRRALKNSHKNNDFDFDEKRLAYERDKVKEEIKQEILKEMSLLTNDAVGLNTTIPAIDLNSDSDDEEYATSNLDGNSDSSIKLHSSNKVPELSNRTYSKNANFSTKMYDFDLFDDLGLESFENNDIVNILNQNKEKTSQISLDIESLTKDLELDDKTQSFPTTIESSPLSLINFNPFTNISEDTSNKNVQNESKKEVIEEKPKIKLRHARLVVNSNKKRDDTNLSSEELIKLKAKEVKRQASLNKK